MMSMSTTNMNKRSYKVLQLVLLVAVVLENIDLTLQLTKTCFGLTCAFGAYCDDVVERCHQCEVDFSFDRCQEGIAEMPTECKLWCLEEKINKTKFDIISAYGIIAEERKKIAAANETIKEQKKEIISAILTVKQERKATIAANTTIQQQWKELISAKATIKNQEKTIIALSIGMGILGFSLIVLGVHVTVKKYQLRKVTYGQNHGTLKQTSQEYFLVDVNGEHEAPSTDIRDHSGNRPAPVQTELDDLNSKIDNIRGKLTHVQPANNGNGTAERMMS